MRARIITGAHLVCYINNKPFSGVQSFTWQADTPRRLVRPIDTFMPVEMIQQAPTVIGSCVCYRAIFDGGLEGQGLVATFEDLSRDKYFAISIVERSSDTVIFRADFASILSQQWVAQTRQLMAGSFTFQALDWFNESRLT
jgi:hypothetical protein